MAPSRPAVRGRPEPGLWPAGVACPTERAWGLAEAAGKRGGTEREGPRELQSGRRDALNTSCSAGDALQSSPLCGGGSKTGREGRHRKGRAGTEARGRPRNCWVWKRESYRTRPRAGGSGHWRLCPSQPRLLFRLTAFGEAFSLTRKNARIFFF